MRRNLCCIRNKQPIRKANLVLAVFQIYPNYDMASAGASQRLTACRTSSFHHYELPAVELIINSPVVVLYSSLSSVKRQGSQSDGVVFTMLLLPNCLLVGRLGTLGTSLLASTLTERGSWSGQQVVTRIVRGVAFDRVADD